MIRNLIAVAVIALIAAPLISFQQLKAFDTRASIRIVTHGAAAGEVRLELLFAATRL
jgi:DNA-binding transcriptional regulator of glucitol operon